MPVNGVSEQRPPRICMPTTRGFSRKVFECGLYEAEDVLRSVDDVELIELRASSRFRSRERWLNRVIYRDVSHSVFRMNPGLEPVRLTKDYDLFVTFTPSYEELLYINAIENWKDRCRTSVCWIDEIWTTSLQKYRHWLPVFQQFDHVLVTHQATAPALAAALGRPVTWLPAGVDTLRFSPFESPMPGSRGIDAYSIGRRRAGIHDALLKRARTVPFFYLHDTFRASVADVFDAAAHRDVFANTAKRSRYFVVAPPKFDSLDETGGQVEVGYRYYEGAAAGCVLIGETADSASFQQLFGWDDVVIPVAPDGSDVDAVLSRLDLEPERLDRISRRNASRSLRSHDWAYRWRTILDVAGLSVTDAMHTRDARLASCARLAAGDVVPTEQGSAHTETGVGDRLTATFSHQAATSTDGRRPTTITR